MQQSSDDQSLDERLDAMLQKMILSIDDRIGRQLEEVIQHKSFKNLEALWRNLDALISQGYPAGKVRIRILDMNWHQLSSDLSLSFSLRDSSLYRRIYQQEFSTYGGHPFGLLVINHSVTTDIETDRQHDDLFTLQLLGELGHEALCPVVTGVSKHFIGTSDADVWTDPKRLRRIFASADFADWRRLRSEPVSQFLGLTLPAIKVRDPWQNYHEGFLFNEQPVTGSDSHILWGNSAFALARNVLREFCRIHWFGFLRCGSNTRDGGAIVDLYQPVVTSLRITHSLEHFYSESGFIPLSSGYLDGKVGIFNNRSVHQPGGGENGEIHCMLQTTLLACRIGHYLKAQIRDKTGSYKTASDCEHELNSWLQKYTSNIDRAEEHILARYPLKASQASVTEDPDTGRFYCQISLQPQYQFDFLSSSIQLRTELGSVDKKGRL